MRRIHASKRILLTIWESLVQRWRKDKNDSDVNRAMDFIEDSVYEEYGDFTNFMEER